MVLAAKDWPDFTNATLLVGVDEDGNPLGVLVDGTGNLTAVLKGVGTEGLQTIGVDAKGRIEVFILDREDQWGETIRIGTSELAARMGSLVTWDWRGNVYYSTDFSCGSGSLLKYMQGTGALIEVSPERWLRGGYSLKMIAGDANEDYARVHGILSHPPSNRMGLQVAWSSIGAVPEVRICIRRYIANRIYYAKLRWLYADATVSILKADGNWQSLGDWLCPVADEAFNYMKVVADFDDLEYVRVLAGATEYDVSAYAVRQDGFANLDAVYFEVDAISDGTADEGIYLDHVILTVNEQ